MAGQSASGRLERIANAFGLVVLLVLSTYVAGSLLRYSGWGAVAILALGTASGVFALATSGAKASTVRTATALAAMSVGLAVAAAITDTRSLLATAALIQLVLMVAATGSLLRTVITESQVSFRTILGAISVYLIFGLLFTSLYVAIDRLQDGPFFSSGGTETGDFIFFSFTTLTTTGYGNLVPAAQPGKMFAGLEMLLGQIFLVTLIAGLVSLWRPRHSAR